MTVSMHSAKYLSSLSRRARTRVQPSLFARFIDYALLSAFILLMIQGLFFNQITLWIVERKVIILNLVPFNLYPSDLILLPGLLLLAMFSKSWLRNVSKKTRRRHLVPLLIFGVWSLAVLLSRRIDVIQQANSLSMFDLIAALLLIPLFFIATSVRRLRLSPDTSRQFLLLLWWITCALGLLNGLMNQNPNLLGDLRELGLRSLLAVATFYLGLHLDFVWLSNKLVNLGVLFAMAFGSIASAQLSGINLGPFLLQSTGVHATLPLLLPFSLALSRARAEKSAGLFSFWLHPVVIAAGIMLTVSKPAIGGLLICAAVTVWIARQPSPASVRITIGFLVVIVVLTIGVLWLFGNTMEAEQQVRTAYLKEGYAIQDLSGGRFSIWQMGIDAWLKNPIVGNGLGYLLSGQTLNISRGVYVYQSVIWPHNIVVQLLMQIGLLGAGLVIIAGWGWVTQARLDSRKLAGRAKWIHASLISVPITVGLMALYGQFLDHVHGGFLLWSCVGLEAALICRSKLEEQPDAKSL